VFEKEILNIERRKNEVKYNMYYHYLLLIIMEID